MSMKHRCLATVGLDDTWMGDCSGTPGAAGMGSDTDAAKRQVVLSIGPPTVGPKALEVHLNRASKGVQ